jgi:hypothetical protein
MYADLDDVTLSEALDHVLQIYPGFWIYGNCPSAGGGRTVFFQFFKNTSAPLTSP